MAIYRGTGGSTSTTEQATIDAVNEDAATATTKAAEASASATAAATSASSASSSATSASSSASTATTKANEASTSATNAATSASAASTSASAASTSASNAASSATTATTQASLAITSAANAAASETAAETAESNAEDFASDAQKSAYGAEDVLQTLSDGSTLYSARHYQSKVGSEVTAAAASATAAAASETAAAASETAAASSETAAASSETAAATSETNAATSATAAASSATSAASSATSANSSEASALTYRNEASTFASNASTSATAASQSATSAATSATNASTSENNAQTYASNALTYSNNASASADAALAALDSFDDRYLGQKTSDPTVDNDGNALVAGALYFNTTDDVMKVYEGSTWVAAYASLSGALLQANNLSDLADASAARTNLGLGTAATTASTDYATAAQGSTADSALQDITGESIEDLSDVATMTPTDGQLLTWDSGTSKWNAEDAPVSLPDQTGASGYYLTTNGTSASWDALATVANSGAYSDLSGTPTTVSTFTNDAGYLTSFTETDPVYTASSWYTTTNNSTNWDTAYGWGDHASGGYLTGNQTITLSGDVSGSGTTSISVTVADDSHNHIISNVDGLQTALDGKQATGDYVVATGDSMTGNLSFGDNDKAIFGAGSDLRIYHDGNNSWVNDLGAGDLILQGTQLRLRSGNNENHIYCTQDGAVQVYHNNAVKLATTSTGVSVTGNVTVSGTVDGVDIAALNSSLGTLATLNSVNASTITDNSVGAAELNVSGNGTTAQFLRSDGDGTFTWATPTDTNTTYSADGNYGMALVGTTFRLEDDRRRANSTVDIYSGNSHDYTLYDADVGIRWYTAGVEEMRLQDNGTLHVDGDVVAYSTTVSDERLKENIVGINDALNKVSQLNGYTFTYKADGKISAGVIAQEVEKVLPEAVNETELPLKADDGKEYKVVNYDALHGLLIEAVKELTKRVEELENK